MTAPDPVSRLLEAIGETEREAPWTHHKSCASLPVEDDPVTYDCDCGVPASVLRRCAADRDLVNLHGIVHRDVGWLEWDEGEHVEMYAELPVCGRCVPKHSSFPRRENVPEGPCRTVRILAEAYGLEVTE